MDSDSFPLRSARIISVYDELDRYARHGRRCVLLGPSGAGKEHAARHYHECYAGQNQDKPPFRSVNCGALSVGTAASELFGHVKGAFTGADRDHIGLFRSAAGGVLFLDEIGDLPEDVVPALLRALDQRHGSARAVGSDEEYDTTGVIVIAATEKPPEAIRLALLARLGMQAYVPGLEERPEDLEPAIAFFCVRAVDKCRDGDELNTRLLDLNAHSTHGTMSGPSLHGTLYPNLPAWAGTLAKPLFSLAARRMWPGNFRALSTAVDAAVVCAERGRDGGTFIHSVTQQFERHAPRYSVPRSGTVGVPAFTTSGWPAVDPEEESRLGEQIRAILPSSAGRDRKAAALARFLQLRSGTRFMCQDAATVIPGVSVRTLQEYLGRLAEAGILSRSGGKGQYYRFPAQQALMAGRADFLGTGQYVLPPAEDLDAETAARVRELVSMLKQTRKLFLAADDTGRRTACAIRLAEAAGQPGSYLALENMESLERLMTHVEETVMVAKGVDATPGSSRPLAQRILSSAGFVFHHCQGAAHTLIIDRTETLTTGEQQQILVHLISAWPWFSFILCGTKMGTELSRLCTEHHL